MWIVWTLAGMAYWSVGLFVLIAMWGRPDNLIGAALVPFVWPAMAVLEWLSRRELKQQQQRLRDLIDELKRRRGQ